MAKKVRGFKELNVNISKSLKDKITLNAKGVKAGFLERSTYPDGTLVADVARWNEYGDPARNRPPRPFFRWVIAEKNGDWAKTIKRAIKQSGDVNIALSLAGEVMVADIQQSIVAFSDPANAPSTIKKKGFNNPLIDTSTMLKSVYFEVIE